MELEPGFMLPAILTRADHADALELDAAHIAQLREGKLAIGFTDYDWSLNEKER